MSTNEELPATIHDVPTPCFLVDVDKVRNNCHAMKARCEQLGVRLRPHMKTHKTIEAAEMMTDGTKRGIVVSTVKEAEFYADNGYDDILYAYPISGNKLKRCSALRARLNEFHLMVDSVASLQCLLDTDPPQGKKWSVFMNIDSGNGREGVPWESDLCIELGRSLVSAPTIDFQGIYAHDGHSYKAHCEEQIQKIANDAAQKYLSVKDKLEAAGIPCPNFGVGSTPSCSKPGTKGPLTQVSEFHPGNYVFYDAMQAAVINSCGMEDIAGKVATRVLGHYPSQGHLLVDCGFLGISHDTNFSLPGKSYCLIQDHPELALVSMTQELGTVRAVDGDLDYSKYPIGSMLYLYPWHSCSTAAMHPLYFVHSGEKIVGTWEPCRGW